MAGRDSRGVGLHSNYTSQGRFYETYVDCKKIQKKNKKEDTKRYENFGQKAGSDKHSDLYTDENQKEQFMV